MKPRTIMTVALSTGLTVATGVLAVSSNILPSSASPRHQSPTATEMSSSSEVPTTVVTEYQDVYDTAPAPASTDDPVEVDDVATDQSTSSTPPAPVVAPASSSEDDHETESPESESESEHDSTGIQSDFSSSSERDD